MTTEIQRIRGAFSLPSDWPRVDIVNLDSGLYAHYLTSGWGADGWTDEKGNASLTSLSSPSPFPSTDPDGVSFVEGDQMYATSEELDSYAGPLTVTAVFRWATGPTVDTSSYLFSTSSPSTSGFYGIRINEDLGRTIAATDTSGETIHTGVPVGEYCVVVAVFDGSDSSISVNGSTTRGSLPGGELGRIRLGNNSAHNQSLHGRIAEVQVHKRALNEGEIQATTSQLRDTYGI